MKNYTHEQMKEIYEIRRARIAAYLTDNNIGAAVYIDSEEHRDPAIPYLTGHNSDAIVIIFSDGYTYLIAWDEILAKKNAYCDKLVPYTRYKNKDIDAVKAILNVGYTHGVNSKVQLPPYLTYPQYLHFIDELNKYAASDAPKSSPILRLLLDIAERGRSLGIVLFSAEQFKSSIHKRVSGNCSTHAYGRTNSVEVSDKTYSFVPNTYKNMMTRLKQGHYIIQNPVFRSMLHINFPLPIYKYYND